MDDTTLETLEWPAVLRELSSRALTPMGRARADGLRASGDILLIREAFREFSELRDIVKASGTLPLGGVSDIRPMLKRVEPAGAYLLPEDFILIRSNTEASVRLKSIPDQSFSRAYPLISSKIEGVSDQRRLLSELNRIFDEKGGIKDDASYELFRLRKEIRLMRSRSRSIIEEVSTDKKVMEILQEDFVTIRDDRYVLAVKAGMHSGFRGVIHGRSGSGATYFIEPLELVELNNRVAILRKDETAEEIRILKEATAGVAGKKEELFSDLDTLGELDFIQAKVIIGRDLDGVVPEVRASGEVRLKRARHPLLILKEKRGGTKVVPVEVAIPEGCRVLVISGANTGGKTVAMKTLGLLTLMALSGIPIPAEEGSAIVAFTSIFSDIGDRQDLIASLSTFSAHIKRIKEFFAEAGAGSLVLIDEIGAGTDPSEGGAFALAALDTFREKGAVTVITTHLNMLKAKAQVDAAYLNASVEFDEKTLKPLYNLHYGAPGPSLGLSIAQSLGIPGEIIAKARENIREKESAFIESVRMIEEEREEVRKLRERLSYLEGERDKALTRLREKREEIIEKAKARVDSVVKKAREEIRKTIEKLREEGLKKASSARAAASVEGIGARAFGPPAPRALRYIPVEGDKVTISGSNSKGVVLKVALTEKKAELMVGSIKVWVAWEKLAHRGGETAGAVKATGAAADMEVSSSLNVIGMRAEEAMRHLTRFLDNAHANGLNVVEIIHGVGTGRLAKAVEEYLKGNPAVKRYYRGDPARGGAGVTMVEME
ncbi:MAG: endonuclease MutS2 [Deltaproteobacteria bacterium]|nr:endonuclease MutS2 [Deltaproteobacteria bacterium]